MSGPGPNLGEARCREILEVGPEATQAEIRSAYLHLKARFAAGGMALPAMDEFAPEAQAQIQGEIEAAFQELCGLQEVVAPAPRLAPPAPPEPGRILDGPALRGLREATGLSLEQLAAETSVRMGYLEALEAERFRELPSAAVIVRGYLSAYLAALGVASDPSVADYVKRFQRWQGKP